MCKSTCCKRKTDVSEKRIRDGELSLSNVAAAQRFFQAEEKNQKPLDLNNKKEILESLVGKSAREAEKELIQRSTLPIALQNPDQIRPKGDEHVEIRFLAPQSLADLLEEAKGLLAHRLPQNASMADLIQALTEIGMERIKKVRFGVGSKPRTGGKKEATKGSKGQVGKVGKVVKVVKVAKVAKVAKKSHDVGQDLASDETHIHVDVAELKNDEGEKSAHSNGGSKNCLHESRRKV